MSDNIPLQSQDFLMFSHKWCFETITSSLNYYQGNGQVERTIQTLKLVFEKADCENKDLYLSLLEFRNTSVSGLSYSPPLILMSKRLPSKLPCAGKLLEPCVVDVTDFLCVVRSH